MSDPKLFMRLLAHSSTMLVIVTVLGTCISKASPTQTPTVETMSPDSTATATSISPTATPTIVATSPSMPSGPSPVATATMQPGATIEPSPSVGQDSQDPVYMAGRTIWLRAEQPVIQPVIFYTGPDTEGVTHDWVVRPYKATNVLAMVRVTVINLSMQDVRLVIDQHSAQLVAADGTMYQPVNILTRALFPAVSLDQEFTVPGFIPLWGAATLSINQQLRGYLVFEVPSGTDFDEFRWLKPDEVIVRYQ